jgi:hypothetical protein
VRSFLPCHRDQLASHLLTQNSQTTTHLESFLASKAAITKSAHHSTFKRVQDNSSGGLSGRHSKMGATLSKLWASIRGALTGGAPAGKNSQHQQPQHHSRNTNTTTKDIESGTHSSITTATDNAMPEVKKWEITEVRFMSELRGWDGGGTSPR